jgi:AcrR family transcriptional regulator
MVLNDSNGEGLTHSSERDREESMSSLDKTPNASTRRERERIRCKGEILAAASALFARHGFEKTSMKQIADEAEISVGGLYSYFRGKEEVIRELLENSIRDLERKGDAACRLTDAPLEQLRCRLKAAVEHFKEHIDFLMIYHNENPLSCEGVIREEIDRNTDTVAKLFARAVDSGDIPKEDPHILAAVFIGSVHGLLHMFAERGNREAFDEVPGIIERMIIRPLEMRQDKDPGMEGR